MYILTSILLEVWKLSDDADLSKSGAQFLRDSALNRCSLRLFYIFC